MQRFESTSEMRHWKTAAMKLAKSLYSCIVCSHFLFFFLFISPPKLVIFFALHNFLTASSSSWLYPSVASCNNYRILRNNPARGWYEFYFPVHVQAKSHTSMLDSTRVRHQLETSPACAREDKPPSCSKSGLEDFVYSTSKSKTSRKTSWIGEMLLYCWPTCS